MPNEKFYDPSVSEDDLPTPPVAKVLINVPARLIVEDGVLYVVSQAALDAWTRRAMQPRLGAPLWPSGVALEEISELAVSMFGGHVLKNRYGAK